MILTWWKCSKNILYTSTLVPFLTISFQIFIGIELTNFHLLMDQASQETYDIRKLEQFGATTGTTNKGAIISKQKHNFNNGIKQISFATYLIKFFLVYLNQTQGLSISINYLLFHFCWARHDANTNKIYIMKRQGPVVVISFALFQRLTYLSILLMYALNLLLSKLILVY